MKSKILCLAIAVTCSVASFAIVPQPVSVQRNDGAFVIKPSTTISYTDESIRPLVVYLLDYVPVKHVSKAPVEENVIAVGIDPKLQAEEYRLLVEGKRIEITGGDYGGVFNGIQTLFQLMPSEVYTRSGRLPITVSCCQIEDRPQFAYRGFMLDVARTWMNMDKVKHYIDILSYHKINKLHFHLTDDEGWRIEIKSHPELTQIGAYRGGSSLIDAVYGKWGERYGGYFTQQQLRELIDYARVRNIEIIPEIDLPGHSRAFARIHPEILCDNPPEFERRNNYERRSAWCATKESNYELVDDVLKEVCELFPSKHIHVGGDEVALSQWKNCPHCMAYMKRHGYTDAHKLEDYFMARVEKILEKYGKTPAVWNEAVNGGDLSLGTRVHGWENVEECIKATTKGYETVVMPGKYFYFDMRQSPYEDGHNWAAIFDTEDCYSFDFAKSGFTEEQMKKVAGVEATFFSELYIAHTPEKLDYIEYMTFPRMCAVSEIAWGKNGGDWSEFYDRLKGKHYDRMASMDIHFRLNPPTVKYEDGELTATVDDNSIIYYAVENENSSTRYVRPIKTDKPAQYVFWSEYRTATSPRTAVPEHYATLKPAMKITSSMTDNEAVFNRANEYRGTAFIHEVCKNGDWILFEFDKPVNCREIEFITGYAHIPKFIFNSGYLETSTDGVTFERVAVLHAGRAKLVNPTQIKAARIVSTCDGNGTYLVVVTPPVIKPILQ